MLLGSTLAGVGGAIVCTGLAHAEPPRVGVELDWQAPSTCPTREEVLADVARMVTASDRTVRARAVVYERKVGASSAYAIELVVDGGLRKLVADRCDAVAEAAAFILALAIDPNAKPLPPRADAAVPLASATASVPAEASAPVADAAAPAPAASSSTPPVSPAPEVADAPFHRVFIAAGVGGSFGLMPKPALAPVAALGVRLVPPIKLSLTGSWLFEQTTEGGIGAKVSGGWLGARLTWAALARQDFELGLSAGASVHAFDASAFGASTSGRGSARWGGALAGLEGTWLLEDHLALRADVLADLAFASPEFVIDNVGGVHRPSVLSACAVLGLEARFF